MGFPFTFSSYTMCMNQLISCMVILGKVLLFTFFLFRIVCITLVSNVPRSVGWLSNRVITYVTTYR